MKFSVTVFMFCTFIAFVYSTPLPTPQEPDFQPIFNAISSVGNTVDIAFKGITNTARDVFRSLANNTGQFVENAAQSFANSLTSAAHSLTALLSRIG